MDIAGLLTGLGGFLTGLAGLFIAGMSWRKSRRAEEHAQEAMESSPKAHFAELRRTVDELEGRATAIVSRHGMEREGMEASLLRERDRADSIERENIQLQAQRARYMIDIAELREEVDELRALVEATVNR